MSSIDESPTSDEATRTNGSTATQATDPAAGSLPPSVQLPEPKVGGFRSRTQRAALRLEENFASLRRRVRQVTGRNPPRYIQPYIGYGNDRYGWIRGRVLANVPPRGPREDDAWWDNLRNMYRRWESDEVAGAAVRAEHRGRTYETLTDDEGYFTFEIDLSSHGDDPQAQPLELKDNDGHERAEANSGDDRDQIIEEPAIEEGGRRLWVPVRLHLDEPEAQEEGLARSTGRIFAVPPDACYGVISDMDDTVIESGITNLFTAARVTFLNNARTRVPLPGVAELYRAFRRGVGVAEGCGNPIFYVSSSAWNLYDLMRDFLDLNDIPLGPLLLRALGPGGQSLKEGHSHKLEKAERILEAYPDLQFVLIGDSGQHDAQLYLEAVRRHPGRIHAIYIRDINPMRESRKDELVQSCAIEAAALGVPMLLVPDSRTIAEHAIGLGLIEAEAMPLIRGRVDRDRAIAEGAIGFKDAAAVDRLMPATATTAAAATAADDDHNTADLPEGGGSNGAGSDGP